MANSLDLRWLLLIAAVLAVVFPGWVFVSFARDGAKHRKRDSMVHARSRQRGGIWE